MKYYIIAFILLLAVKANDQNCENCTMILNDNL